MNKKLKKKWERYASFWIKATRDRKSPNREGVLDLPMLQICGQLKGLHVLDLGCGEGRFSRMMKDRGAASVLGIDFCEAMIEAARELQSPEEEFLMGDVQDLSFLEDDRFDLAVSYLNQNDIPDVKSNTMEVFRVVKPCGRFVICTLHPMRTAKGPWCLNDKGEKEHFILDNYFEEGERIFQLPSVRITNFHRTLTTCINTYLGAGFQLKSITEPRVTNEALLKFPELMDDDRVPGFVIYELIKP